MKHGNSNRKLGREKNQRNALLKSMARSLVLSEKIQTTEAKAKALKPFVEKIITRGKNGNLQSRRMISSQIGPRGAKKVVEILGPKYKERSGGYSRIIKMPSRLSDGSKMAIIELV